MLKPLFTIFTPTFNRINTLSRAYNSLKSQTYNNFEWLIVDDGSQDGTYELIKRWQKEVNFPIRYFWQENQGKHIAFNKATQEAYGEFLLPLDSDDACTPEALERFKYHWDLIPEDQKDRFTGICALCKDQYGKLVGDPFPFDPTDSNSLEIYYRYKVKGEKWGFQRIDILHHFPFPENPEMKFIPEGLIWNAIAKSYKVRFVNEALRIYWRSVAPDSDQLTNLIRQGNRYAGGCRLYYGSCLNEHIAWFRYAPFEFIRYAIHYIRFSLHSNIGFLQMVKNIRPKIGKILVLLAIPVSYFLYHLEKRGLNLISIYKSLLQFIMYKK